MTSFPATADVTWGNSMAVMTDKTSGLVHSEVGPAILYYSEEFEYVTTALFQKYGIAHRTSGPQRIDYNEDGVEVYKCWRINGEKHRLRAAAEMWFYPSGMIRAEKYFEKDQLHRVGAPAVIFYDEHGNVTHEYYYEYGRLLGEPVTTNSQK